MRVGERNPPASSHYERTLAMLSRGWHASRRLSQLLNFPVLRLYTAYTYAFGTFSYFLFHFHSTEPGSVYM